MSCVCGWNKNLVAPHGGIPLKEVSQEVPLYVKGVRTVMGGGGEGFLIFMEGVFLIRGVSFQRFKSHWCIASVSLY